MSRGNYFNLIVFNKKKIYDGEVKQPTNDLNNHTYDDPVVELRDQFLDPILPINNTYVDVKTKVIGRCIQTKEFNSTFMMVGDEYGLGNYRLCAEISKVDAKDMYQACQYLLDKNLWKARLHENILSGNKWINILSENLNEYTNFIENRKPKDPGELAEDREWNEETKFHLIRLRDILFQFLFFDDSDFYGTSVSPDDIEVKLYVNYYG